MAPPPLRPARHILRFVLPPSLGRTIAAERAQQLEQFLSNASGRAVEVSVAVSYDALAKDLLAGRIDAAWAPPFVCARVESMGARVVVRGVRNGASSYRAALVCREDKDLTLGNLGGKRAAWVDQDSVGGYLLAIAYLRSKQIDPAKTFFSQEFTGSYAAALEAVAESRADVTSIFAPAPKPGQPESTGVIEVAPVMASKFKVIGFTDEAPNDGVVVSPASDPEGLLALERVLLTVGETDEGRTLLKDVFHADAFEPAPRMGYRALYRVALSTL